MAIAKSERLMNLTLRLMTAKQPLSKKRLRHDIEAYREVAGDEAFNRMFERDKDELREMGLVIETAESPEDGEIGYRALRDVNALPEIDFDPEETAAIQLARRVWQHARMSQAATGAMHKLRAAGVDAEPEPETPLSTLEARIPVREEAFEPLLIAARDQRPVTFDYRRADSPVAEQRTVEPWALEFCRGRWYLAGYDRQREAPRVFRLSRITGKVKLRQGAFTAEVSDRLDVRAQVERFAGEGATSTARIRLRRGAAHPLRARALSVTPAGGPAADEWEEVSLPHGRGLGAWLAEFGPDVVVLEPAELREDVISRLRAVAGAAAPAPEPDQQTTRPSTEEARS
ncbi:helix-turn-helix transcriptional regulator [Allostreptomyces psammosilenae]|uniref:Putative DNA-binding transcriptional regulator YafY n=1 Tax=Allostreptomyces psammosilenae TaxID=1892865 RepID=A0A852ZQG6_9ACTN|nr:WYL domain-containing protein [Allostreptomyces psammosilenae]NYI03995.1 putative DNA-binding transcriptional regulator YafY [Allostreptomyces psammosilenae]